MSLAVKRCRSVTDRSRLWQVDVRALVRDICCALHHAGFVFLVAAHDVIEINSILICTVDSGQRPWHGRSPVYTILNFHDPGIPYERGRKRAFVLNLNNRQLMR